MKGLHATRGLGRLASRWLPSPAPVTPRRLLWLALALTLVVGYALWPFATLWRINQAVVAGDPHTLTQLLDLDAVREELGRRLNKERTSAIEGMSDAFIDWIDDAIRRSGVDALRQHVTLHWVEAELASRAAADGSILGAVRHAWFRGPVDFRIVLARPGQPRLHLRLSFGIRGWRITMVHY